jgi:prepilin-type N-terminal cleavage/methylation domain-containing protein
MLKLLSDNQKGMSLIEVTVAAAISVVIAAGVMKINETSVKGMQGIQEKSDVMEFRNILNGNLLNKDKCSSSVWGTNNWTTGASNDGLFPPKAAETPLLYRTKTLIQVALKGDASRLQDVQVGETLPWGTKWNVTQIRLYNKDSLDNCHVLVHATKKGAVGGNAGFGGSDKYLWFSMACDLKTAPPADVGQINTCASTSAVADGYFQDNDGPSGGAITGNTPVIIGTDPGDVTNQVGSHLHVGGDTAKTWGGSLGYTGATTKYHSISIPENYVMSFGDIAVEGVGIFSSGGNLIIDNGNVGIGTTAPTRKFVAVDGATLGYINNESVNVGVLGISNSTADSIGVVRIANDAKTWDLVVEGRAGQNDSFGINVVGGGGGRRFTIDSSTGNVGIGTATPISKLDVTGDVRATGAVSSATVTTTGDITVGSTLASQAVFADFSLNAPKVWAANEVHSPGFYGGNFYGTSFLVASDKSYKKRIRGIQNASEKLSKIVGVSYFLRKDEFPEMKFSSEKQIGLIAQNVEKYFPELVTTNPHTGKKGVKYSNFVAILIEAFKEQNHEVSKNTKKLLMSVKSINNIITRSNKQELRIEKLEIENKKLQEDLRALSRRLEILENSKE